MITNEVRKILKISEYINLLEFNRVKTDIINQQIPRLMKMSINDINKEFINIHNIVNDENNIRPESEVVYDRKSNYYEASPPLDEEEDGTELV